MKKIAVFPGSFDPFTKGHENVVAKAAALFDQIIIAVGENSTKTSFFTKESKLAHIQSIYAGTPQVEVVVFSQKLTVELCRELGANYILRGLRDVKDFEYERSIAQMNHKLEPTVETLFLVTDPELNHINSTIVREISKNGGVIADFVTNPEILVR